MSAPNTADDGVWRDPERLPLSELRQAMATYSADGQVDDLTGGDAGAEAASPAEDRPLPASGPGDPDPDSEEGRRLRPSFEDGLTGPV